MMQLTAHNAAARTIAGLAALDTGPTGHPAVLLVPGYTGSKEDFAPLLDPLAEAGYRAVAVDLPGQHHSPGPEDPAGYAIDALAETVNAVAATLGERIHLIGHSFGGLVSRAAVIAEPGRYATLTLLASGPAAIDGGRKERMALIEPLLPHGHEVVFEAMARVGPPRPVPPPLAEFYRRRFFASPLAALKAMGEAILVEPDRTDALRATGVPALVCYGSADDAWAPAIQADMARRLGAAEVIFDRVGHSPAIERPDALMTALLGFWADTLS